MATVSLADSTNMLPNPKQIGGDPLAIQDKTSSSTFVGSSIVSVPTKGRWPSHLAHSSANPGKSTSS
jgi:hypothetical protein